MHIIATQKHRKPSGRIRRPSSPTIWFSPWARSAHTAAGEIVAGSIQTQTEQVFDNLEAVLRSAGSALNQAVSVTVFMTDLRQFPEMNEIFARRFGTHRPGVDRPGRRALPTGRRSRSTPARVAA